jgi:hypothetical protein
MKLLPLLVAFVALCAPSFGKETESATPAASSLEATRVPTMIIAGKLDWIGNFVRGARNGSRVAKPAYQYTGSQDRRGSGRGVLYYLMQALWRTVAAATAAGVAGSAAEKHLKDRKIKNAFLIGPFLIALFTPIVGLFVAGILWLAMKEGNKPTEPPQQEEP